MERFRYVTPIADCLSFSLPGHEHDGPRLSRPDQLCPVRTRSPVILLATAAEGTDALSTWIQPVRLGLSALDHSPRTRSSSCEQALCGVDGSVGRGRDEPEEVGFASLQRKLTLPFLPPSSILDPACDPVWPHRPRKGHRHPGIIQRKDGRLLRIRVWLGRRDSRWGPQVWVEEARAVVNAHQPASVRTGQSRKLQLARTRHVQEQWTRLDAVRVQHVPRLVPRGVVPGRPAPVLAVHDVRRLPRSISTTA